MTKRRMYITGGIGSSGYFERFTTDWDLPNDSAYCETCASVGLALFALRMARITREGKYIDVCERALYNTVRAGIAMTGDRYFYVNPLEVWPASCMDATSRSHVKAVRQGGYYPRERGVLPGGMDGPSRHEWVIHLSTMGMPFH